jgi:hypothetical protein
MLLAARPSRPLDPPPPALTHEGNVGPLGLAAFRCRRAARLEGERLLLLLLGAR